jgi:MFS transporter, MHS family, citrate/tricarballylate:H+ symporter
MAVELWLSFLFASYNGALIVFLAEIMPPNVRTAGFSLVHSSATAIFGGFTPATAPLSSSRVTRRAALVNPRDGSDRS